MWWLAELVGNGYTRGIILAHIMEVLVPAMRPWYRRWWGILLLLVAVGICTAVFLFGLVTWHFWRQIKAGQGAQLSQQLFGGFTATGSSTLPPLPTSPRAGEGAIADRTILENVASPFLGNSQAPLTMVEFTDFKCPNCQAAAPIIKQVLQKYPTKIKFIMRHFPVESTHPGATELSEIVYCAGKQGKLWRVHDLLFANQAALPDHLDPAGRARIAAANDIDDDVLQACLSTPAPLTAVNRDYVDGARFGVRGTPTFFINGERVEGVVPFATWDQFLQRVQ